MNKKEIPGKRSFYKYMAPETALAVFTHKTFRYSSPLLFNDPFDIQSGLHFEFDIEDIYLKILNRLEELAKRDHLPNLDGDDPWAQVVKAVWENYPSHGFPRKKWLEQLAKNAEKLELVKVMRQTQIDYAKDCEKRLPTLRVFCVSEERDNLLMWAHYAKDHTGIVAEVLSLPEEDNPLSVARRVTYIDSPPPFYSEEEWLDDILLQKRLDHSSLSIKYAQTKSNHWAYEKEWRVWYPSEPHNEVGLWSDMPIRPSELKAVYFGCRMEEKFEAKLVNLISDVFPNTEKYRAKKLEGKYELGHEKI